MEILGVTLTDTAAFEILNLKQPPAYFQQVTLTNRGIEAISHSDPQNRRRIKLLQSHKEVTLAVSCVSYPDCCPDLVVTFQDAGFGFVKIDDQDYMFYSTAKNNFYGTLAYDVPNAISKKTFLIHLFEQAVNFDNGLPPFVD